MDRRMGCAGPCRLLRWKGQPSSVVLSNRLRATSVCKHHGTSSWDHGQEEEEEERRKEGRRKSIFAVARAERERERGEDSEEGGAKGSNNLRRIQYHLSVPSIGGLAGRKSTRSQLPIALQRHRSSRRTVKVSETSAKINRPQSKTDYFGEFSESLCFIYDNISALSKVINSEGFSSEVFKPIQTENLH